MQRLIIALITSSMFITIGYKKLSDYRVLDEINKAFSVNEYKETIEDDESIDENFNISEEKTVDYECKNNESIEGTYKYISVDELLKREINIRVNDDGSIKIIQKYISLDESNNEVNNKVEKLNYLEGNLKADGKDKWSGTLENKDFKRKVEVAVELKCNKLYYIIYAIKEEGNNENIACNERIVFSKANTEEGSFNEELRAKATILMKNYTKGFTEAVNTGQYFNVSVFMEQNSSIFKSQEKVVKDLYKKGITGSIINMEIVSLDFEQSSNVGKIIVKEKYRIKYDNGGEIIKTFKNGYKFKYNKLDKKLLLTEVKSS